MKLKIAICDDERVQTDYLKTTVTEWARINRHLCDIKTYPSAEAFLFDYGEDKSVDILLLDIEMKGMSGVELAKSIRRENNTVQLIFVTGFYEYFSDGFDVSALHYLIKPATKDKLYPVLDRAADNLAYRERSVLIDTPDGEVKIPLADIIYIEADKMYVNIVTVKHKYRSRMAFSKITDMLDDTFTRFSAPTPSGFKYVRKISKNRYNRIGRNLHTHKPRNIRRRAFGTSKIPVRSDDK